MTNWIVYQCDLIKPLCPPRNERPVEEGFPTAMEAMERADELKRSYPQWSYTVGGTEMRAQ